MSEIKVSIPAMIELKVLVTNGDGTNGVVTFEMPAMQIPTPEDIINAINEAAESEVVKNNDMRLCNQKETFDYVCIERSGSTFAMPSDCGDWLIK